MRRENMGNEGKSMTREKGNDVDVTDADGNVADSNEWSGIDAKSNEWAGIGVEAVDGYAADSKRADSNGGDGNSADANGEDGDDRMAISGAINDVDENGRDCNRARLVMEQMKMTQMEIRGNIADITDND